MSSKLIAYESVNTQLGPKKSLKKGGGGVRIAFRFKIKIMTGLNFG